MTQEEKWLKNYEEAMRFLNENKRKPSRYVAEERNIRNWWKATKKLMNAGLLKAERVKVLEKLLELETRKPIPISTFILCKSFTVIKNRHISIDMQIRKAA